MRGILTRLVLLLRVIVLDALYLILGLLLGLLVVMRVVGLGNVLVLRVVVVRGEGDVLVRA